MTLDVFRLIRERMDRLTESLVGLRDRVRHAVAGEMAKAAAEAFRDLLHAVLLRQARTPPAPAAAASPFAGPTSTSGSRWDDDEDEDEHSRWHDPMPWRPAATPSQTLQSIKAQALRTGVGLATWLLHRRVPLVAGLGAGLLAGVAALSTHPLVQTCLAVAVAAAELVAITESFPRP